MKNLKLTLALNLVFSIFINAQEFNDASIKSKMGKINIPLPDKNAAVSDTIKKSPTIKKWTIMVFMNSKNNLENAGLYNINQMESVGSNKDVNIVVEMGRMNGQKEGDSHLDGDWTGVRRFYIEKDTDSDHISSQVVFSEAKYDMGDYKQVVNFVKWTKENYPAKKYVLILWDHGSGWLDPQQKKTASKGISFDDETGNYIRTKQIGSILKEGGKVNILAFDACLMQMSEVVTEVKRYANVVVGSEETVPGYGYPYNLWLNYLSSHPEISDEDLGAVMVESFKKFYEYVKQNAMLSAIRTSKIDGLNKLISEFAELSMKVNDIEAMKKARTEVLRFDILANSDPKLEISFFGDLYNFADIISKNLTKEGDDVNSLKAKIEELKNYISTNLVIDKGYYGNNKIGHSLADANGISLYIPPVRADIAQSRLESIFEEPYSTFDFDKDVKWHNFVDFIYKNVK